jgi:hypothetical protein
MMQIGDLQPQPPAVLDEPPAEVGRDDKPAGRRTDDREPLFVSPPPAPWPRVFPGL